MRHHHVIVSFGEDAEFELRPASAEVEAQSADSARQWFDREFVELGCELPSPIGKVLSADRVLSVAKYSGARRFREHPDWAQEFARNAVALFGRDFVRVDVANAAIGY